jgi:hypothetical protein
VGRSWHAAHLNLIFISYSFWNIRRKVLIFYKFDEKRAITLNYKRQMVSWNCKHVQHVKIYLPCNFEMNLITYLGVIALFSSIFYIFFLTFRLVFQKLFRDRCSSWLEVGITGHNFGRGPSNDYSTKVWLQLAQWFLRRRFLCDDSWVVLLPKLCPAFQNSDQDGHHSRT